MSTFDSSVARSAIFDQLRKGLKRTDQAPSETVLDAVLAAKQRGPVPAQSSEPTDLLARFIARSESLASTVTRVASLNAVPQSVADYLAANKLAKSLVVWPEFTELAWPNELTIRPGSANGNDLVGLTGCFCAIAETGTLMLCSGQSTPATASLLPETHIAIVDSSRIVPAMEDGFALLRAETVAGVRPVPRAVNFISGPSRTADIEQTIVLGAHGPYRVHLIIVGA
jgi:L-lactate dehydrogenase complex protein LldG